MYIFVYINKPTYETIYYVEITKNYLVSSSTVSNLSLDYPEGPLLRKKL